MSPSDEIDVLDQEPSCGRLIRHFGFRGDTSDTEVLPPWS
jgi:hypothetical protein